MATTQAEKQQQNDVNSDRVQPDQHLNVRNSLLQNGTDKSSGVRASAAVISKGAKAAAAAAGTMSQYRQDGGGNDGLSEPEMGPPEPGQGPGPGPGPGMYPSPAPAPPGPPSEGPPPMGVGSDGHGAASFGFPFGQRDMHNSGGGVGVVGPGDGSLLHGFPPRQAAVAAAAFGGQKQQQQQQQQQPPAAAFPQQQQRFLSGQTISQPTGPTPTLNQLLQSSNPMQHRYQNSYGHPEHQPQPYGGQGWAPQKPPLAAYGTAAAPGASPTPASYRNQTTVSIRTTPFSAKSPTCY